LMALKQTKAAGEDLRKANDLAKAIGRSRLLWQVYEGMAKYHRHRGELGKAQENEREITRIVNSIANSLEDKALKSGLPI
jgi:hypothetical protein